jgi:predicted ATPase
MSLVVGVSGAQGAGKTTLLEALKPLGWQVDDFKVSRAVQADMGFSSLQEATQDPWVMADFQERIFHRKLERDTAHRRGSQDLVLVERTFADVAAYATRWVWDLLEDRRNDPKEWVKWLGAYTQRCAAAQKLCYGGFILIPFMPHVQWQNDPNRAPASSTSYIFETIEDFIRTFSHDEPLLKISTQTVGDRVQEADAFLKNIFRN